MERDETIFMGYTVLDIINNLVYIGEKELSIFKDISNDENKDIKIKIISHTMKKQCSKHIEWLKNLKIEIGDNLEEYIDFHSYDKISSRIQEFKGRIFIPVIDTLERFKVWLISIERDNLALLLDIRGRLVKKENDVDTLAYITISKIIDDQKKYLKKLMDFLNKKS